MYTVTRLTVRMVPAIWTQGGAGAIVRRDFEGVPHKMGWATRIFTWWLDNTIGTTLFTSRNGRLVGTDELGNRYYEDKAPRRSAAEARGGAGMAMKRGRRWVLYEGEPEASKVPQEWHAWLHYTVADPPKAGAPKPRFELPHQPNLTGTELAYHPKGSVLGEGQRAKATGDYEPWRPS
jgi:NADH:ubiquinone oxidoreductase subunit